MRLQNNNPTETEKLMFKYYGLYLISASENGLKYAPVHADEHLKNEFPYTINDIGEDYIEWENSIYFDHLSETASLKGFFDVDEIILIEKRMKELGYSVVVNYHTP